MARIIKSKYPKIGREDESCGCGIQGIGSLNGGNQVSIKNQIERSETIINS